MLSTAYTPTAADLHDLTHVEAFLFDLDDVLYPHGAFLSHGAFWEALNTYAAEQNDLSIDEAVAITNRFRADTSINDVIKAWAAYARFDVRGFTDRIDAVDIATRMQPCRQTLTLLSGLKGRRVVFTNAHCTHAERILRHLQMDHLFEHISTYGTRGERLKPEPEIYTDLVRKLDINPTRCVMVEDTAPNLAPAHHLGMTTVLIHPEPEPAYRQADFVHRWHPTLPHWLERVQQ